jgi:hypothetical protein
MTRQLKEEDIVCFIERAKQLMETSPVPMTADVADALAKVRRAGALDSVLRVIARRRLLAAS